GHYLNPAFAQLYLVGDELGSGGYGFVMTALHRRLNSEVAVKFVIKEKVPEQAWINHDTWGRIPMEVMLLRIVDHENIVKCLDIFEDELFFYSGVSLDVPGPHYTHRPSHDLFECIEQTKHKRLSERQARYIFAQVVEAVYYLDSRGITHRDIKDENLVIDKDFKVKLIDFGSATMVDPNQPRPFYNLFFGTTAYAASEVLLKRPYQAAPAEIWTIGVLMSYLLTGISPFPTEHDAIEGRIVLSELPGKSLSHSCLHLMSRCLEPDPSLRADIKEVRGHRWLKGA
ncbi:hypothetical protein PAXINDRAFT_26938, partial [Paxillus involutus ATCC 200175]